MSLEAKCRLLRELHVPGKPLVLPNAWDAASAKAVVEAGFPVVATTSGGVAASLGYEDHEQAPAGEMLAAAARIAKSVDVPVSVDAEAGYGLSALDLVDALIEAGVAGCNLEDTDHRRGGLTVVTHHAEWLAAVRQTARARAYELVINARVDVFIPAHSSQPIEALLDEGISRARAYVAAGADCVYPILLTDGQAIERFAKLVDAPVNIMALPSAPPIEQLVKVGVARISYGSMLHQQSMSHFSNVLSHLRRQDS